MESSVTNATDSLHRDWDERIEDDVNRGLFDKLIEELMVEYGQGMTGDCPSLTNQKAKAELATKV